MDVISDDIDRALPTYTPATAGRGGPRSPTAPTAACASSTSTSTRPHRRVLESHATCASGPHRRRRPPAPGQPHRSAGEADRRRRGISDVPWHKDCSIGLHSYRCCGITVGVSVTGADATSVRSASSPARTARSSARVRAAQSELPVIELPTRPATHVHCSCTLHMSQPPVDRERRVMYTVRARRAERPGKAATGHRRDQQCARGAYTPSRRQPDTSRSRWSQTAVFCCA